MLNPKDIHENIDFVAYIDPHNQIKTFGKGEGNYRLASVTKLLSTLVFTDAIVHEFFDFSDIVDIDYFGDNNVTFADLLAHASGTRPEYNDPIAPRTKRIYTNEAFELAEQFFIKKLGSSFSGANVAQIFSDGLKGHLGDHIHLESSCAHGAIGDDEGIVALMNEIRNPSFIPQSIFSKLTQTYLPELEGILPGWGNYKHNTFGIGFEIKGDKTPHWTSELSSPQTYGHFGQSGAFIFHDPENNISGCCLSNSDFAPWAKVAFPVLSAEIYKTAMS